MEYKTAMSYRNFEWATEPFEENGKMYVKVKQPCSKCDGKGKIAAFAFRDQGVCYDCQGAGYFYPKVRLYTEKEIQQQQAAKERKEARRIKALEDGSEENKRIWMEKHNFDQNGITWCIVGEDTYAIKDWLKNQGCKFDPLLKWHSDHPLEIPADYRMVSITFDQVFEWHMYSKDVDYKENAKEVIERKLHEDDEPSASKYVGEIGERLRNITAIYKSARGYNSQFGYVNIYTFQSGENILVWFTTKDLDIEKGAVIDLTATVKKHEEFRGVKTTQLSRAIIKEVK